MSRRSLVRAFLVAAGLPLALGAAAVPVAGSATASTWTWVALPNSGGVQVHCTAPVGRASVSVRWLADGTVTASFPIPLTTTPGNVTMAAGCGLAVRWAGAR